MNTVTAKFVRCSRFSKCLIFLAVLLVIITATAQAIHFHPDASSANEIKNCAVCQLAAATALAILVIALPILRRRITFAFCSEQPQAGSIFASFNLFSRPPPLA